MGLNDVDPARRAEHDQLRLVARVAALLFVNGQTTEGTRIAVDRLSGASGQPILFEARWGDVTIRPNEGTFGVQPAATPVAVDIVRVVSTELIVDQVCAGLAPHDALARLDLLERLPPVSLSRFAVMAAAGAAALGVIFGAADVLTLAVIAACAGAGAVLRRVVSRLSGNPFAQPFTAALLAGLVESVCLALHLPVSHRLVAVCPCMVLVPGPHFLNGTIDLVRVRIPLGAARVAFASLVVAAISAGLLVGLSSTSTSLPAGTSGGRVPFGADVVAAGVAVAAYGAFFNMPWRLLPIPVAVGMVAHSLRWWVLDHGCSVPLGAFLACLVVGILTTPLAHRLRIPFGASAFAAVVSLVPGVFMFEAASEMVALVSAAPNASAAATIDVLSAATTAVVTVLAMTSGLVIPKLAFDALGHSQTKRMPL